MEITEGFDFTLNGKKKIKFGSSWADAGKEVGMVLCNMTKRMGRGRAIAVILYKEGILKI